jgi:hypothetical protein
MVAGVRVSPRVVDDGRRLRAVDEHDAVGADARTARAHGLHVRGIPIVW